MSMTDGRKTWACDRDDMTAWEKRRDDGATLTDVARFIPYIPPLDWFGAQAYCRQFHTDLASATTSMENKEITKNVVIYTSSWFGLFRDTWTWTDETIATNIPWDPLQPTFETGNENCATFAEGLNYNTLCSNQYAFYCHSTPPVRQVQIIKMQVDSDANVFDPAIQLSILRQINLKLVGLGMVNITVSWRVQPNGNIFYKKEKNL
ncbi:uncharacterized protein LOC128508449 [Clarias gariepinus]|uniref:uncharacterized protein LOC128508449 n=1 Tax=Clarias gariepinus TaxID=13013 RepID=UPI00234DA90C|nr:uncharacterized protein LOC128508449 [Clarias gariepinus]